MRLCDKIEFLMNNPETLMKMSLNNEKVLDKFLKMKKLLKNGGKY